MSSLYKIEQELLEILEQVEEQDGVLDADTEQLLAIKREELEFKVIGYDQAIKYLIGEGMMAQLEIERLQKFVAKQEKIVENLRKSLLQALLLFGEEDKKGIKRLKFGTIELSTRKSPPSIKVEDEDMLDSRFKLIDIKLQNLTISELIKFKQCLDEFGLHFEAKQDIKISKTLIKKAIDSGEEVEYASLEEGKIGLVIK
jgi:hypothetical protein